MGKPTAMSSPAAAASVWREKLAVCEGSMARGNAVSNTRPTRLCPLGTGTLARAAKRSRPSE